MKKLFISQKVVTMAYIALILLTFLYSLWFITDYTILSNKYSSDFFLENFAMVVLYDGVLQGFNSMIFNYAIIGLVSIIVIVVFKMFSKVGDKISLITTNVFAVISITGCFTVFNRMSVIKDVYSNPNLLNNQDLVILNKDSYHILTTTAFDAGVVIYSIMLAVSVLFIAIPWVTHFVYLKKKAGEINE